MSLHAICYINIILQQGSHNFFKSLFTGMDSELLPANGFKQEIRLSLQATVI